MLKTPRLFVSFLFTAHKRPALNKRIKQDSKQRARQVGEARDVEGLIAQMAESVRVNAEKVREHKDSLEGLNGKLLAEQERLGRLNQRYEPEKLKSEKMVSDNLETLRAQEARIFETSQRLQEKVAEFERTQKSGKAFRVRCQKVAGFIGAVNREALAL